MWGYEGNSIEMNDMINGLFEICGSMFGWYNNIILIRDKEVKGFSKVSFSFFVAWGYWNLHYYPSLEQWWSFWGAVMLVTANTVWLLLALYYTYRRKL